MLQRYGPWLRILARVQMETRLRRKFDPSDVVQQTLLEAYRALPKFRGETEEEFIAWLKGILVFVLGHEVRRYRGVEKRNIDREIPIEQSGAQTSQALWRAVPAAGRSPSQLAIAAEQEVLLAEALDALPPDYREVIILRNLQDLAHEEVARRMNRSVGAVRMLWVRALAELRKVLKDRLGDTNT